MNSKQNQYVKISGIIGVLGLALILLLMLSMPWNGSWSDSKSLRARQKAEILGYQLLQIYQENLDGSSENQKSSRSIASIDSDQVEFKPVGLMGMDPWGQPYHYSIQKSGHDQVRVVIWSKGPDQKDDSQSSSSGESLFSSKSDDVQIVLNIPIDSAQR